MALSRLETRILRGAGAGAAASLIMSAGFVAAQRAGTIGKLPPRLIVEHIAPELPSHISRPAQVLSHLGYGAAAGAVYSVLPANGARAGVAFGLLVWATSYEAWVPLLGVIPPAHSDERPRALTILAAHVLYGAALGLITRRARAQ